jgi:TRAP transporter TAXI family solute receptor
MGNGIASVISRHMTGYSAKVEATGGSVDNLKLLATNRIDLGFSMADASWDAYSGLDKFKSGKLGVRALMVLYANSLHVVTLDRPDINKIEDLKGRRLATGAPGSATEVMALRVLEAHGMDKDKDITRERLALEESVNALKEKKVDALFWSGGVPTAAIAKLAAAPGIKIKFLDHDGAVEAMVKKYGPLYSKHEISANAYPGLSKNPKVAGVWNILVVSESMNARLAYNIVKTIFEHKAEVVEAHKEAANISLEYQRNDRSPIPFHPGAVRYFAEKGIKLK